MASAHEASIFTELLTLSFKRQYCGHVLVFYVLFEPPFVKLILELFLSMGELSEIGTLSS